MSELQFLYTFTGQSSGTIIRFTLPQNPVPDSFAAGTWRLTNDLVFTINGAGQSPARTALFTSAVILDGGFALINSVGTVLINALGVQIYKGTTQNPVIAPLGPVTMTFGDSPFYNENFTVTAAVILTTYQVLFIAYVQQCLNAGIGYNKASAIAFVQTKLMAPMKTWPVVDFSQAIGVSQGFDDDWDDLVENNLLPTQPQQQFQPNGIPLTSWVRNQIGKN